ncbi:hypothetical protein LTR84_006426 [Exophiala bonariae]|uniref:Uncharacterized protein n=1 Tax=Exophiala bonariae TaxID=1690606 RepID=A0AAV9N189_9EURO|nr:hypothetical protein LTR84_006426 [Exophiala bonariae]
MKSSVLSNLSGVGGYDFVVAVTQASINATMITYLDSLTSPEIIVCYISQESVGTPGYTAVEVEFTKLLELTEGVDPFTVTVPSDNQENDPNFQKLLKANFIMGFKARIGIPNVPDKSKLKDIVSLQGDTAQVGFNLMCSEFTVAGIETVSVDRFFIQSSQTPASTWLFSTQVDLRLGDLSDSGYSRLSPEAQRKIKNLSDSVFSIQQLLIDLSTATLAESVKISGVEAGSTVETFLEKYFIQKYIAKLKDTGEPMLGCAAVSKGTDRSTMLLTDMDFSVSPYVDSLGKPAASDSQKELNTLNYLCATDHRALGPAIRFPWNWVDESERADHDGCISINRTRMIEWLEGLVKTTASYHCLRPTVFAKHHDGNITRLYVEVFFNENQQPVVEYPDKNMVDSQGQKWNADGKTVLKFSWEGFAADDDQAGNIELRNKYAMTVDLVGSTIVITQNIWVWYYVRVPAYGKGHIIVNDTLVDEYSLSTENGALVVGTVKSKLTQAADPHDRSANISDVNDFGNKIIEAVKQPTSISLTSIPLSVAPSYVFPGGKSFLFKNVQFSENQDLVACIAYADPVQ